MNVFLTGAVSTPACSYRPQSQFQRPRRLTERCAPTGRAPCWPALAEQSPSTATGEAKWSGRSIKGSCHHSGGWLYVSAQGRKTRLVRVGNYSGLFVFTCDWLHSVPSETSRTSAWVEECWTAQVRHPGQAPAWPPMPAALSASSGLRTARGEVWRWSSARAEQPVPAPPQIPALSRAQWKNFSASLLTVQLLVEMSGGRFSSNKRRATVWEMGWELMEVGGKREY